MMFVVVVVNIQHCSSSCCCSLRKNASDRPRYSVLLEHQFVKHLSTTSINISMFVCDILDTSTPSDTATPSTWLPLKVPSTFTYICQEYCCHYSCYFNSAWPSVKTGHVHLCLVAHCMVPCGRWCSLSPMWVITPFSLNLFTL